jgi:hypothetical protein
MKRRAVVLSAVIALLLVAGALAMTPFGRRAKRHATADGAHALAALKLPAGARRVRGDDSVNGLLGAKPARFGGIPQRQVVDDMSFWHVPGKPRDVEQWVAEHPPAHFYGFGRGGPRPLFVEFTFVDKPGVTDRSLDIELWAAKGGGTAVRVDGVAVWLPHHRQPSGCGNGCY